MTTVEFPADGGGVVLARLATVSEPAAVTRGLGDSATMERAGQTFEQALDTIRAVADGVLAQLAGLARRPEEVRVQFGLELSANAKAMVVAAGTTAHLQVELTWRPAPTATSNHRDRTNEA